MPIPSHPRCRFPLLAVLIGSSVLAACGDARGAADRPNVLLIMTDDQGYGDLGVHGNPKIRTPVLDAFAKESLHVPNFFVCPVCSPTRASLMTGRYNYRTGVVDTYLGRSMMRREEITIAEQLRASGYRTGIFGKWHLGDNYPLRPQDQGFEEVLVHRGGGITQPAGPPGDSYFDPVLQHNGKDEKFEGYCSDVFTNGAIDFVSRESDGPFFAYLAFNCPHTPLEIADQWWKPYDRMDLSKDEFPRVGFPLPGEIPHETTARIYGMVENIDWNLGRLFEALKNSGHERDTIVIFITDNGPQQVRYNAGLRGRKGTVYEGGIRVPCYIRWPGELKPETYNGPAMAHIDILPTLLSACGVGLPGWRIDGRRQEIDGKDFLPALRGEKVADDRTLYFQWHRGDEPELYRAFCARGPRYKLVQAAGVPPGSMPTEPAFQLFDIVEDPYELKDISEEVEKFHPGLIRDMKQEYGEWFRDVGRWGYEPPAIFLGDPRENPVTLTLQDVRGPNASWGKDNIGHWVVSVRRRGPYQVTPRFEPADVDRTIHLTFEDPGDGSWHWYGKVAAGATEFTFEIEDSPHEIGRRPRESVRISAVLSGESAEPTGPSYMDVEYMGER